MGSYSLSSVSLGFMRAMKEQLEAVIS